MSTIDQPLDPSLDAFISALPKVEIHLHLVGSASPQTVLELARRHPGGPVPTDEEGLRAFYEYRDFPHFAEIHEAVAALVRRPEDIATLVVGAARDVARQNVRYAELTVTPYTHTRYGIPAAAVTEALNLSVREARDRYGVQLAYVFDIAGELGGEAARHTLDHALAHPPQALVGFGLAGIEQERPPHRDAFRAAFRAAREAGLRSVPHAGEMTGPETIWEVIEGLRAERIGHGISCLRDPRLVAHLRETQIPLEICPTSNLRTGQVRDIADHPLPRLLAEGLFVTLNSDDPPMFGTTLTNEYRLVARAFGLDRAALAGLARNGVTASCLDEPGKRAILQEIAALVAVS